MWLKEYLFEKVQETQNSKSCLPRFQQYNKNDRNGIFGKNLGPAIFHFFEFGARGAPPRTEYGHHGSGHETYLPDFPDPDSLSQDITIHTDSESTLEMVERANNYGSNGSLSNDLFTY
jgi:hypothetical protein